MDQSFLLKRGDGGWGEGPFQDEVRRVQDELDYLAGLERNKCSKHNILFILGHLKNQHEVLTPPRQIYDHVNIKSRTLTNSNPLTEKSSY